MAYHYSNPAREHAAHALPDVETFEQNYAYCSNCGSLMQDEDAAGRVVCQECVTTTRQLKTGWFWWHCLPGCLPDGEPNGPFGSEALALADARENAGDDDDASEEN